MGLFTKTDFITLIKTLRITRHLHYSALFLFGYFLGIKNFPYNFDYFYFIYGLLWINLLFFLALILNNIYDKFIDKINNKKNPLNNGINKKNYLHIFSFIFCFILLSSAFLGIKILLLTFFIIFISYIYSVPPFRFKKFFPLNIILISFCGIITIFSGYLFSNYGKTYEHFPFYFAFSLFIVFSLAFNVKDINDVEGDRKNKISTIMTLYGYKNGKLIINLLMFVAYIIFPFLINKKEFIFLAFLCGIFTFFFIQKSKKINETPVFLTFFIFLFYIYKFGF